MDPSKRLFLKGMAALTASAVVAAAPAKQHKKPAAIKMPPEDNKTVPAYTFNCDTDTGIGWAAEDKISFIAM